MAPSLQDGEEASGRQCVAALWKRHAHSTAQRADSPPAPVVLHREALQRLPQRLLCCGTQRGPALTPLECLYSQASVQETSPSLLLTACSEGLRLLFYFRISLDFYPPPLNLVFLFRNQHMIQTASSKFSIACDMENAFSAAWDMYLEIMVLFIHIQ